MDTSAHPGQIDYAVTLIGRSIVIPARSWREARTTFSCKARQIMLDLYNKRNGDTAIQFLLDCYRHQG